MTLRTTRAGRSTVHLALEALEGRTLPSATTATPALGMLHPAAVQSASSGIKVNYGSASVKPAVASTKVGYSYRWTVGPSPVIVGTNSTTGNGRSTGSVDFALVRPGTAGGPAPAVARGDRAGTDPSRLSGPATEVLVGYLVTTCSADTSHPDSFHSSFTLQLRLRDSASGASGVLTFKGTITGRLSYFGSRLTATFQSPTTQKITLGSHVYTVTLPRGLRPPGPNDMPLPVHARVQVSPRPH